MDTFLDKLLKYYNITLEEYENLYTEDISLEKIPDASFFNNHEIVGTCVRKHIAQKSKILIYGDYDCDGIIGTSIVEIAFKWVKAPNISHFIPSRYVDGYGLNLSNAKKIVEKGFNLIICVDNGISQIEAIQYCVDNGVEVIVCDHHQVPDVLPPTPYIIHPFFSKRPDIICSGGFCAYILASMIERRKDLYALSLAGITIVSDMMKLVDYNREVVTQAIKIINENRYKQIVKLNNNSTFIDEGTIGGYIAPRINAVGRLQEGPNTNRLIEYFTTEDEEIMDKILKFINDNNEERKLLCKNANTKLSERITSKPCIVFETKEKEGIIGLIAGQFTSNNKKPAIVMTAASDNQNILKASMRSKPGTNVIEMLKGASEYLIAFGGHDGAGGFSIKRENLPRFLEYCQVYCRAHPFIEVEEKVININANDINTINYYILTRFGPFGEGNKRPKFRVLDFPTKNLLFSKNQRNIIVQLSKKERIVMFNKSKKDIPDKAMVSLYGVFGQNEFNNSRTVNFYVEKME